VIALGEAGQSLNRGLQALGLDPLDEAGLAQFWLYFSELQRWNRKINLVAKAPDMVVIESHFLDSLTLLPEIGEGPLLDVGSGAGFPGLALKIARPALAVLLLEPRQKRVGFLRQVIRCLRLEGVAVVEDRLEPGGLAFVDRYGLFPVITSRAFAEIALFLELVAPLSPPGGRVLCMKGPRCDEEIRRWRQQAPASPFTLERSVRFCLPFSGAERNLVVFVKRGDS